MKETEFIEELKKNNIFLSLEQIKQFKIYANFLLDYNHKTNLTAIRTLDGVYLKHFYDSASLLFYKMFTNESMLDIGTGAGFPGIVLKIICPNIKLTVIDSNNKKTTFIKLLLEKLHIKDVTIINDRVENLIEKNTFDIITSRAVSSLRILSELSLPYLKKGGNLIFMKSSVESEINESLDTINILGGDKPEVVNLKVSNDLGKRVLIIVKKVKETPNIYPRVYDKILKYPLKK